MNLKTIRELHRAQPFQPFMLHVADQRRIEVRHPEFLSMLPETRTAQVFASDGTNHYLDLLLVTGVEIRPMQSKQKA